MAFEIQWLSEGNVALPELDYSRLALWLDEVARRHNRILGPLTYIFCDDTIILDTNRQYLGHDYFTDIITFDNTMGRRVSGDMFISLDTVATNAQLFDKSYMSELHRVIIHGLLHLCGINDKGPGEREVMESYENDALNLLDGNDF